MGRGGFDVMRMCGDDWGGVTLAVAALITRNEDLARGMSYFLVEAEIFRDLRYGPRDGDL